MNCMMTSYEIGDQVIVGDAKATIVKVINDHNDEVKLSSELSSSTLYLVQDLNDNQFTYHTEDKMKGSGACNERSDNSVYAKRQRIDAFNKSTTTDKSVTSTSSSKDWSRAQIKRFNITFQASSSSVLESKFVEFFLEKFPENDDDDVKKLLQMDWNTKYSQTTDPVCDQLTEQLYQFQLDQSESSVKTCIRTMFQFFTLKSLSEKQSVEFGRVDMLLSKQVDDIMLMNCAVENKRGGKYDNDKHVKYRSQLAANIISIAIHNAKEFEVHNKKFSEQNVLGILHMGLTPIFYKVKITDEYLDSIRPLYDDVQWIKEPKETASTIPELIIFEFAPIRPYCDRELLISDSRPIIFKCYKAFKKLMDRYTNEKIALLRGSSSN